MPHIVQAEFFLVDIRADSLDVMLGDTVGRLMDGAPLKLCLRFYDENGAILRFAQQAEHLDAVSQSVLARFITARGLKRWWLDKRSRWIGRAQRRLRAHATVAAMQLAKTAISGRYPAAVELHNHRFASVEGAERHELVESMQRATGAWLFVFEPGPLCFERNSLVASLM